MLSSLPSPLHSILSYHSSTLPLSFPFFFHLWSRDLGTCSPRLQERQGEWELQFILVDKHKHYGARARAMEKSITARLFFCPEPHQTLLCLNRLVLQRIAKDRDHHRLLPSFRHLLPPTTRARSAFARAAQESLLRDSCLYSSPWSYAVALLFWHDIANNPFASSLVDGFALAVYPHCRLTCASYFLGIRRCLHFGTRFNDL